MMSLKEEVENKIFKDYMIIGHLKLDDFKKIDKYCKDNYDNNRKQMVLDLIRYKEENIPLKLLDDKLHLLYNEFHERLCKLELIYTNEESPDEKKEDKKRPSWPGFSG